MKMIRITWVGAIAAIALAVSGQNAAAQTPQGYYGYPSKQAPAPSGQGGGSSCQPGCYVVFPCCPEKWGCCVYVCTPPSCQNAGNEILRKIPGQETPSCQNAITIYSDAQPSSPQTVTVYRNHYVPIKIQTSGPSVTPVNIEVKYREIHYLCDCAPGTSQCPHIPNGSPQSGGPSMQGPASAPQDPGSVPPPPPATAAAAPAAAPVAAPVAEANTPAKRWIYLAKQGVYGYGFQRPDGFWVIDPNSKRPTSPEGATTVAAPAAPTVTAAAPAAPTVTAAAPVAQPTGL